LRDNTHKGSQLRIREEKEIRTIEIESPWCIPQMKGSI
jgi:hypothetical protein